jgi:hypothetical protein
MIGLALLVIVATAATLLSPAVARADDRAAETARVVVVDAGKAKTLTTTTARADVYAFIYGQKGLMAGLGLQGSEITKTSP